MNLHPRIHQFGTSARARPWRTAFLVLLLLLVILILVFDWNWFKKPLERAVRQSTGREFAIRGDLDVDLGFVPTISAEGIYFGNADWAKQPEMASVRHLEIDLALRDLLHGELVFPRIHLQQPRLRIERDAQGRGNWQFDTAEDKDPEAPSRTILVRDLHIVDGELSVHEVQQQTDLRLELASGERDAEQERAPLLAQGQGRYRGFPFELKARIDSPLDLSDAEHPYRLDLRARAGGTRAQLDGALASPLQLEDFDLHLALSGTNLAQLYPLVGVALPETPPYKLDGRVGRSGEVWSYNKMSGTVGDSDVAGDVSVDLGGERPMLRAALVSKRLDLDDLAGFLGATPATGEGEAASAEQRQDAQAQARRSRVLPDHPYDLSKLKAMDADASLAAANIETPDLPIDSLKVHLKLDDGLLRLDPLELGVADGNIKGTLQFNARAEPIAVETKLKARALELSELAPDVALMEEAVGRLSGSVDLRGRGASVAQILGGASGELGAVVGKGQVSNLLIELAGLDIAEALRYFLGKDRKIELRCAYADFGVENGLMSTRAFAVDTTDTVLHGDGNINLKDETLALRIVPQPRDRSPISLRSPLIIGGTFKDPSFRPQGGPLLLRGAAAAALFAIAPPAALLALIETGPGEDAQCGRVTAAAVKAGEPAPAPVAQPQAAAPAAPDPQPPPDAKAPSVSPGSNVGEPERFPGIQAKPSTKAE